MDSSTIRFNKDSEKPFIFFVFDSKEESENCTVNQMKVKDVPKEFKSRIVENFKLDTPEGAHNTVISEAEVDAFIAQLWKSKK